MVCLTVEYFTTTACRKARPKLGRSYNHTFVSSIVHRKDAPASVRCFVLTVSDSRTEATDTSGDTIIEALRSAGHEVAGRRVVRDDPDLVRQVVTSEAPAVDVVITTGGTGITSRDSTYEAITGILDKRLEGFGELFRMLSYEEIGSAAMLSRACAGTVGRTAVFSLPGSPHAVRLAMEKLIVPEIGHVVRELRR
jgi:molybdopterin adenylyltransferase